MTAAPTMWPELPARVHELVADDPAWTYKSGCIAGRGAAHLLVWRAEPGHLAIVTDLNVGASITNSAEHIHAALVDLYGEPLVLLEHYRGNALREHQTVDQVTVSAGTPRWRRIWPTSESNPMHAEFQAWSDRNGRDLLLDLLGGEHG